MKNFLKNKSFIYLKVGPRLAGTAVGIVAGLTVGADPTWGLILAAIFMGTSCTDAVFGAVAVVKRMEVPDPGPPLKKEKSEA